MTPWTRWACIRTDRNQCPAVNADAALGLPEIRKKTKATAIKEAARGRSMRASQRQAKYSRKAEAARAVGSAHSGI